ncbi:modifier protein of major autolysin LytC, partial [Listeria grandensis FSL F6-0971]
MTKSKMKKVVTSALVANLVMGSIITALPLHGAASENETITNTAEKKLVSNLKATQNLLKNTNFTSTTNSIPDWNAEFNTNLDYNTSINAFGTKNSDGWFDFTRVGLRPLGNGSLEIHGTANSIIGLNQTVNTIPGKTYTIAYNFNTTKFSTKTMAIGTATYAECSATDIASGVKVGTRSVASGGHAGSVTRPNVEWRTGLSGSVEMTFVATGNKTRIFIGSSVNSQTQTNELYQTISGLSLSGENYAQLDAPALQAIKNQDSKVTGSLNGSIEALKEVQIYKNDIFVGTATVTGRNFEMNVTGSSVGDVYKAYAVDLWDVKSNPATQTVTASAIAKPTINTINDKSVNASGTGEPSSTLTLKIGDATYTANVNADGNWSTTITKPKAGLVAEATSVKAGVTSPKETTTVVDVTAPDAPILSTVTDKDTHVKGTGEANTTVKIKLPNNTEITGTVDTEGKFDVIIPAQAKDAVISATLTDAANNVSLAGATTVVHAAPSAPLLDTVTDKSTKVTGTGDVGNTVTVKITDNGMSISYTGTVDDFGDFSIPIDTPKAGATVDAIAKDKTNALSPKTSTTVKDVTAPDAPNVNIILDTDTTITGNGEANCDVKVTLPSGGVLTGRTNATGVFTIAIPAQAAGKEIKVTLTDAASNESTATPVIVQSSAIASPTINSVTTDDTTVKGTGTTGATVTLTIGSATYTGTVIDGSYAISIPKQTVGTIISAKQALNGRTSASVTTTVTASKELAKTTINPLTNDSTIVSGTGEPNASIEIKNAAGTVIATGSTDAEGDYSLTIPKQTTGAVVTANVTKDGESSSASTTVTKQTAGTVVVNAAYYVGYDTNVKATVSGDATKVYLLVGDTKYTTVPVSGSFQYYAKDKITSTTQNAYIVATDASGRELSRAKVTLKDGNLLKGAVTANGFTISDSSYVSGSFTGSVSKVAISVNGTVYPAVAVGANNKFQYYAKDKIKNTTDVVKVIGYNSEGTSIATSTVTLAGPDSLTGTITPNPSNFVISTDAYVKGTFTGNVKYVSLVVNSVESAKVNVMDATNWQYYAKGKITNPTDVVSVKGYNAAGTLVDTKTITVTQNPAGTSTITPAAFKLKTDTTVKGTFTGSVKTVALKV